MDFRSPNFPFLPIPQGEQYLLDLKYSFPRDFHPVCCVCAGEHNARLGCGRKSAECGGAAAIRANVDASPSRPGSLFFRRSNERGLRSGLSSSSPRARIRRPACASRCFLSWRVPRLRTGGNGRLARAASFVRRINDLAHADVGRRPLAPYRHSCRDDDCHRGANAGANETSNGIMA